MLEMIVMEGPFWHEGTETVCRELQPASVCSAVSEAAEYRVRCIEREGKLSTSDNKYARGHDAT